MRRLSLLEDLTTTVQEVIEWVRSCEQVAYVDIRVGLGDD